MGGPREREPSDDKPARHLLVVGVGNLLAGDDGVGIHVVQALKDAPDGLLPPGCHVVDGGTLGLALLPLAASAEAMVVVDALELGAPPGSIRVLRSEELEGAFGQPLSVHQLAVADLLAVGRLAGTLPEQLALVGVQPAQVEVTTALSPGVQSALPAAIEAVAATAWGFIPSERPH